MRRGTSAPSMVRTALPLLTGLLLACDGPGGDSGSICGPTEAVVARVIDGDTVELDDGQRVRYLLVDTPEITGGKDECYGAEARDFNRDKTVESKAVTLTYDEAECTDDFDRLLAFISIGGRDINALIIERGFGRVLFIPPSGEDRRDEYEALEARAQAGARRVVGGVRRVTRWLVAAAVAVLVVLGGTRHAPRNRVRDLHRHR